MTSPNRPMKVAHRGGAALAPENTLAAFDLGLTHQPDAVELDLHMSRDGALVVIHDPALDRLTGKTGEISDLTWDELQQFNAAATYTSYPIAPQPIPALADVLERVRGHAEVQIEIKLRSDNRRYPGIEAKVVDVVEQYGMTADTTVISFDFSTLQDITALAPVIRTGALFSTSFVSLFGTELKERAIAEALQNKGFQCVGANYKCMTPTLLQAFRDLDLQVGVWTVNEESDIRHFIDLGVDFITSDRPDLLQRLIPTPDES